VFCTRVSRVGGYNRYSQNALDCADSAGSGCVPARANCWKAVCCPAAGYADSPDAGADDSIGFSLRAGEGPSRDALCGAPRSPLAVGLSGSRDSVVGCANGEGTARTYERELYPHCCS